MRAAFCMTVTVKVAAGATGHLAAMRSWQVVAQARRAAHHRESLSQLNCVPPTSNACANRPRTSLRTNLHLHHWYSAEPISDLPRKSQMAMSIYAVQSNFVLKGTFGQPAKKVYQNHADTGRHAQCRWALEAGQHTSDDCDEARSYGTRRKAASCTYSA